MSEQLGSIEITDEGIRLRSCPDKFMVAPLVSDGIFMRHFIDVEWLENPENEGVFASHTACENDCPGPKTIPRKILGIKFGEKEVCGKGMPDRETNYPGSYNLG